MIETVQGAVTKLMIDEVKGNIAAALGEAIEDVIEGRRINAIVRAQKRRVGDVFDI